MPVICRSDSLSLRSRHFCSRVISITMRTNVLQESVPDKPVDRADYEDVLKSFEGKVVFYSGQPKEMLKSSENADRKCYQMIIDVDEESYVLSFYYDKVIAQWEHFMNKVMN